MLQHVPVFLSNMYIPRKHGCRRINEKMRYTFSIIRRSIDLLLFVPKQLVEQLRYHSVLAYGIPCYAFRSVGYVFENDISLFLILMYF